ncbi:hypothetical protein DSL64_02640 [Dyadobacter luteus]|jgi:hypothetical protein|uniref:Lipocalin-like domain-containing protein n=1 Tax=Dyadobacter luteus TaxID=2259619 RepID=A0A3D8YI18_9BACT|nr:hypothetical protein DSL64_02640 [Dyadobacter luteus]
MKIAVHRNAVTKHYLKPSVIILIAMLFIVLFGCKPTKQEVIQPDFRPEDLIGNWTTIPNGQPYLRWTLDKNVLSETWAKSTACEPVVSYFSYPYTVVADTLLIDYGIPKHIQDNFYIIKSLTPTRMVLYRTYFKEEAIFEKCM